MSDTKLSNESKILTEIKDQLLLGCMKATYKFSESDVFKPYDIDNDLMEVRITDDVSIEELCLYLAMHKDLMPDKVYKLYCGAGKELGDLMHDTREGKIMYTPKCKLRYVQIDIDLSANKSN